LSASTKKSTANQRYAIYWRLTVHILNTPLPRSML